MTIDLCLLIFCNFECVWCLYITCVYMCMHDSVRCYLFPPVTTHLFFWDGATHQTQGSLIGSAVWEMEPLSKPSAHWLAQLYGQWILGILLSLPPWHSSHQPYLSLYEGMGIWTHVITLAWQAFYWQDVFLAPMCIILNFLLPKQLLLNLNMYLLCKAASWGYTFMHQF